MSQASKYFQGVCFNLAYFINMIWIGVFVKTVRQAFEASLTAVVCVCACACVRACVRVCVSLEQR
jgi:hypothetical protein